MPQFQPKDIQKELSQSKLWPVYWLVGPEQMKARELIKRIRGTLYGATTSKSTLNEETLDGRDVTGQTIVDAAHSLSLSGEPRLIIIREAHLIKEPDVIQELFTPHQDRSQVSSVVIGLSDRDLDKRKKLSKAMVQSAAVVSCAAVAEADREAWIQFLAKRKEIDVSASGLQQLRSLDPWSLDIVEHELQKLELSDGSEEVLLGAMTPHGGVDEFLDAFFKRDLPLTLDMAGHISQKAEESFPLLGLLAWNVRQFAVTFDNNGPPKKISPYLARKFESWRLNWNLNQVQHLQKKLAEVDFSLKQTPRIPLAVWTDLVLSCRSES